MCDPVTLALTAVSTVYGLYSQKKAASEQAKAVKKAQAIKEDQLYDRNSAQADARLRQARAERARLRAQSAETGVSGISVTDILNNVDFQSGMDVATMTNNNSNDIAANTADAQNQLNAIRQPDYLGTALNAGLQLYGGATPDQQASFKGKFGI